MNLVFKELKPTSETEWLKLRLQVLTATEVSGILGLNPFKSPKQILEDKKKIEPFENAYTITGQLLEPVVVAMVNRELNSNFKLFENGSRSFFLNEDIKMGATPDAGNEEFLLECKTTRPTNFAKWSYWPPLYYLCQLYVQLICINKQQGYLAIVSTNLTQETAKYNPPMHMHLLTRTEEIDAIIVKEVKRFWECAKNEKMYRVDRKQAKMLEISFRNSCKRV